MKHILFLLLTCTLLISQPIAASEGAEVFDIRKGEIIRTLPNSNELQTQVKEWLSSITGPLESLEVEPRNGIAIKIPLTPPYSISTKWITGTVTEVVMFVSSSPTYYPTLLIFSKERGFAAIHFDSKNLKVFLEENKLYDPGFNLSMPRG
ncbi:hypothetical protein D3C85_1376610 [compost metagenome]